MPAPKKRNIDPQVAHDRARRGAAARNSPDGYIKSLSRATLTTAQKRRLAALLMPFLLADDENEDVA